MKTTSRNRFSYLLLSSVLVICAALSPQIGAEDIDLFVADTSGAGNPNVLIVLDNSSNWSANNQNWPTDGSPPVACGNDCNKQGYYELKAIRTVVNALPTDASGNIAVNLGLMLFNNSNASRDGGYVRYHVRPMTATNKSSFLAKIDSIISNFNTETAASSVQYGAVLFDAFKYFGGLTNPDNAATNTAPDTNPTYSTVHVFGTEFWGSNNADGSKPDGAAYSGTNYVPPTGSICGRNHIIFIGNGFPAKDNTVPDMGQVLKYLKNPASPPSSIAEFEVTTYLPAYNATNCPVVTTGTGATCSKESDCTPKLTNYPTAGYPDLGNFYRCEQATVCTGSTKYKVKVCPITAWNSSQSVPTSNAEYRYGDEFTDFLYSTDVSAAEEQQNVTTHTINVFKDQPSVDQEGLMRSMAKKGGGLYYSATTAGAIESGLKGIFAQILSVNSNFASASLPVNATNRAQNENQVFIGMFRPDPYANPRWFGNLKRYQLAWFDGELKLADSSSTPREAVNTATGFVTDCATSYWTTDSFSANGTEVSPGHLDGWWKDYPVTPTPAGTCADSLLPFSDSPDGPRVEKGAVAEVIRKGNAPSTTNTTPTWAVNRTMKTLSGSALATFGIGSLSLGDDVVNFVMGQDINDEDGDANKTEVRASLHGAVIHSRPLPVTYGSNSIKIFYGASDGTLRAVDAGTGKEDWAFVAPEFSSVLAELGNKSPLERLKDNSPKVSYPDLGATTPTPQPMSYFFDGSMGLYQNADNTQVWIYPTMRRGGSDLYALDITNPTSPVYKWKYDLQGQSWSRPNVAFASGYASVIDDISTPKPMLVVGGGYDTCEDADTASPSCTSPKGAAVYMIDADTGVVIRSFTTTRSVAADLSLVDVTGDGKVDYAYAADTGGNLYRLNFVDPATNAPLSKEDWGFRRIAYTNGAGRKFLFGPALLPSDGYIYLAIGSGDREHPLNSNYPYPITSGSGVLNRFYVFLDDPTNTTEVNLDDEDEMNDYTDETTCDTSRILPASSPRGWFMDLNQYEPGEQTVTGALIIGGMATFSTNSPDTPSTTSSSCGSLGVARGYWVNLLNASGAIKVTGNCGGDRSGTFVGGGLPPTPVTATVPVGEEVVTVAIGAVQKSGGASSGIEGQEVKPTISSRRGRVYWLQESDN